MARFFFESQTCVVTRLILEPAKQFVAAGNFFWNSGIFLWTLQGILAAFRAYLPDMAALFESGADKFGTDAEQAFIDEKFAQCVNISIDYGVMEKAGNLGKRSVKAFLIVIKYLPHLIMVLEIIRTFSCIFGKQTVVLSYIGGTSYLVLLFMLLTSFVFDFCSYHRVPIYYILANNTLTLWDYYVGIPISNARLLDLNLVLVGITVIVMTVLYCKERRKWKV